ncbi:MAG: formate dehydrogenase [Chloroflexi bacterium CG23_combo_of_CG06-09_8_20_14_all_45_10]|nr:MAG: formate dehydrogenase [Chloroflexi bacterium CG23_combo_of_CG06-09_8_20_14_all_45_10]
MKGDMCLAWSSDEQIFKRAEYGGAVTALLKFALESRMVDAVLAVKARDGNRYDGVPVLITEPEKVIETAGSLHCVSPNIARCLKEYLNGAFDMKIAVACKPCDARAIIELVKRTQIEKENLILIGLNCTGTLPSATAKRMFHEEFGIDPSDVIREDIEEGKLTIRLKDGTEKEKDLDELEEKGYGRRENCRRCDVNIPVMADIACGKWGTNGRKATFIEVCSEKGSDFIEKAIEAGYIKVEKPDSAAIETRKRKDEEEVKRARKQQEKDFAFLRGMSTEEKFNYWLGQFSRCIKCYGCRDACPICYCKDCTLEADRGTVPPGEIPPDIMFPMIRIVHVMDSCVNCGQCQDVCPAEIPLSRLIFMLNRELGGIFKYEPGMDINTPIPLKSVTDKELTMAGVEIQF